MALRLLTNEQTKNQHGREQNKNKQCSSRSKNEETDLRSVLHLKQEGKGSRGEKKTNNTRRCIFLKVKLLFFDSCCQLKVLLFKQAKTKQPKSNLLSIFCIFFSSRNEHKHSTYKHEARRKKRKTYTHKQQQIQMQIHSCKARR